LPQDRQPLFDEVLTLRNQSKERVELTVLGVH